MITDWRCSVPFSERTNVHDFRFCYRRHHTGLYQMSEVFLVHGLEHGLDFKLQALRVLGILVS